MTYDLLPFTPTPERAEIVSKMLRGIATTPTLFSDTPCERQCIAEAMTLPEMCPTCLERMQVVASVLGRRDTRTWEVWGEEDLVGLIFFTHVTRLDAVGHYVFFDRALSDKTKVIQEAMSLMFEEVPRLTVEIPKSHVVLAKHAARKLGFGGDFQVELAGRKIYVEGIRRGAALRNGKIEDLLVLGLTRPSESLRSS